MEAAQQPVHAPLLLPLREFHQKLGANFISLGAAEVVADYGAGQREYAALRETAGFLDLSFRSRICLTGADRVRFLHGQITNDVKKLAAGEGCYAAITTAKGKMQSDLNVFCLPDELLLDFEPGLTALVSQRLEKYLVADDVQVVDVTPHYGLLSVQGPQAAAVVRATGWFAAVPTKPLSLAKNSHATLGDLYLINHARVGSAGCDLFIPLPALGTVAVELLQAARALGGSLCGWNALEIARVEAGIPRFGADMDESNIPIECGIEARAISYQKGCYIGQEVLNRIHSMGHVNLELCGLQLAAGSQNLPARGDKLFLGEKELGTITSAVVSPRWKCGLALGYVRRGVNAVGTELLVRSDTGEIEAQIVALPFAGS